MDDILFYLIMGMSFLCWGSFLNAMAFRLVHNRNLITRSSCPHCERIICWYDLFPVASYIILKGRCRSCKALISPLYPLIEGITCALFGLMISFLEPHYFLGYGIFFSSLIISIRSDLETMLISRWVTLYAVPIGWLLAYTGYIPLSLGESIIGSLSGYGFLLVVRTIFYLLTKREGIGQGDLDMIAFIGSFIGASGAWNALFIGSTTGAIISIIYLGITRRHHSTPLPFGPFLACGAIVHIFFQKIASGLILL